MRMASRCHRVCFSTCASTRLRCVSPTGRASKNFIIVDDPVANGNPYATLIATPVTSGTRRMTIPSGCHMHTSPLALLLRTHGLPMPTTNRRMGSTAGFFVKIFGVAQYVDDSHNVDPSGFRRTFRSNGVGTDIKAEGVGRVAGNAKFLRQFCWTSLRARRQSPLSIRHRCLRLLLSTTIGSKASTTACRYQATQ